MNIQYRIILRSAILLFGVFFCSAESLKAQVYFDSVYQDYIYVYKKVREFDMSFTEAMPITASKTFILENKHIVPAVKEYRNKYPDYNEQDILVELSADVTVKFLEEEVYALECKNGNEDYMRAYSNYICNCVDKKSKAMPGYKWTTRKDSVMEVCATSFLENIDDEQLKQKMNILSSAEKVELQECAKVYSHINCERLSIDLIGECINRAERYYYFEKGLRMKKEVGLINKYIKEGQLLPSDVFLKGKELTDAYTLLLFESKGYLEIENIQTYEVQDWDNIYTIWYTEKKDEVEILFGVNYSFGFKDGKAIVKDMSYMTVEEMMGQRLLKENIERLSAAPILGGSE